MKEKKFRVWKDGQMIYSDDPKWNMPYEFFEQACLDFDDAMQYTGVKDKNGKEIYEGDIVLFGAETDYSGKPNMMKGKVRWGEYEDHEYVSNLECWKIIRLDDDTNYIYNLPLSCAALSGGVQYGRGTSVFPDTLEVVGHIYDKPTTI